MSTPKRSPLNETRAELADFALLSHTAIDPIGSPPQNRQESLRRLLVGLMHHADHFQIDFVTTLSAARDQYVEDRLPELDLAVGDLVQFTERAPDRLWREGDPVQGIIARIEMDPGDPIGYFVQHSGEEHPSGFYDFEVQAIPPGTITPDTDFPIALTDIDGDAIRPADQRQPGLGRTASSRTP
jgi:hypothetical protein